MLNSSSAANFQLKIARLGLLLAAQTYLERMPVSPAKRHEFMEIIRQAICLNIPDTGDVGPLIMKADPAFHALVLVRQASAYEARMLCKRVCDTEPYKPRASTRAAIMKAHAEKRELDTAAVY